MKNPFWHERSPTSFCERTSYGKEVEVDAYYGMSAKELRRFPRRKESKARTSATVQLVQ
jgi:hypothetical protein